MSTAVSSSCSNPASVGSENESGLACFSWHVLLISRQVGLDSDVKPVGLKALLYKVLITVEFMLSLPRIL